MSPTRTAATLLAGLLLIAATPAPARAKIGANDVTPAATLLIPYFEVSLDEGPDPATTVVSVVNTKASSLIVRVQLWTDQGLPTEAFLLYLTGYDMEVIDLRQWFVNGLVPGTASRGQDPSDKISPQGATSQDINFANCAALLPPGRLDAARRGALVAAHQGRASPLFEGSCGASAVGLAPDIVRGFVTMDTVNSCVSDPPTASGYFLNYVTSQNQLTGFFEIRDPRQNLTFVDDAVHLEASESDPLTDGASDATFYGHLHGFLGQDHREPLGPRWRAKFELADPARSGSGGGTDLIAFQWGPSPPPKPWDCTKPEPSARVREILVFDEQEQVVDATQAQLFPRVTQRVALGGLAAVPFQFGMIDIDFRLPESEPIGGTLATDPYFRNAVVFAQTRSVGRFGVGLPAVLLPTGGTP